LRLALEARAQIGATCELRRQDLDGDAAVEPGVACAVDLPHPARAERRNDLVWTEARSWGEFHGAARVPQRVPATSRGGGSVSDDDERRRSGRGAIRSAG